MKYQWPETPNTPNSPGVWARKCVNGYNLHDVHEPQHYAPALWVRVCDLPTIVDSPKYREVNQGDVGKPIQVKAGEEWRDCYFIGFLQSGEVAYEDKRFAMKAKPEECRILDDGQPKRAEEFWLNVYEDYCHRHVSKEEADEAAYEHRLECFKVRRVS